jgi:hypothetical protein
VVDFVLWSFVIALAPVALGLTWKCFAGILNLAADGLARAFDGAKPRAALRPLKVYPSSGSIAMSGRRGGRNASAILPTVGGHRRHVHDCGGGSRRG